MVTVPACSDCNQSFKRDDEYTGMVLALDSQAATHRDVIGTLPALMRRLQYPQGRGFATSLAKQSKMIPVLAANGTQFLKLTRDLDRIAATGRRLIRGLHYIERQKPLDPQARITLSMSDYVSPSDELIQLAVQAYDASKERRQREIGAAFSYVAGFDDHDRSVWVMMLYGYFFWFATVGEP